MDDLAVKNEAAWDQWTQIAKEAGLVPIRYRMGKFGAGKCERGPMGQAIYQAESGTWWYDQDSSQKYLDPFLKALPFKGSIADMFRDEMDALALHDKDRHDPHPA